jgi:hypothetical protein
MASLPSAPIVRDSAIHILPMSDFIYDHRRRIIVNDSVITLAHTIAIIVAGQFFTPLGSGIFGRTAYFLDASSVTLGSDCLCLFWPPRPQQPIFGHGA